MPVHAPWPVVDYRASDGSEPVDIAIDSLLPKIQVVIDNQIEILVAFGPQVPFPHSSQVRGELRELRCHYGRQLFRILYCRSDNLFVLLHLIAKRSAMVPEADISIALERWTDFTARMNVEPRRPPRPVGRDAP